MVGGGCTLIDFILFAAFHELAALGVVTSNILSYGTGLTIAFFINRAWTFRDSSKRHHARVLLSLFFGYLGLAINTGIIWFLVKWMNVYLAKATAVIIIVFYNYLTNRYVVFYDRKAH